MNRIAVIFGTRPEAIKLAPVVRSLIQRATLETEVWVTGQHRQMLDQIMNDFEISPDVDLDVMAPNQTLADLSARCLMGLSHHLSLRKPQLVMVQGDTTTAFIAALTAYYHQIPVAHVEAGLRTSDLLAPWPEEGNRCMIARLANLNFAPTNWSRDNLLREGVAPQTIHVTGNTAVDALFLAMKKLGPVPVEDKRKVLITGHRRESWGEGFASICEANVLLARKYPEVEFVYPVHLNPVVRKPVFETLQGVQNIKLMEPLNYFEFVSLMRSSHLILTDSGGIQEEAPSLGIPVLVMRDETERPEGIEAGTSVLTGTATARIVSVVSNLLDRPSAYRQLAQCANPYGDGQAANRIAEVCCRFLNGMS